MKENKISGETSPQENGSLNEVSTNSNEKTDRKKLFTTLSYVSFSLGLFFLITVWWLLILIMHYAGEYIGAYGILAIVITFNICNIIGIVTGALSIKKGKRKIAKFGLISNSFLLAFNIYCLGSFISQFIFQ